MSQANPRWEALASSTAASFPKDHWEMKSWEPHEVENMNLGAIQKLLILCCSLSALRVIQSKTHVWMQSVRHQRPWSALNIDAYLVLVFSQHLMGQVEQADDSILCHTFPHERHGVSSPLDIKWGDHLNKRHRLYWEYWNDGRCSVIMCFIVSHPKCVILQKHGCQNCMLSGFGEWLWSRVAPTFCHSTTKTKSVDSTKSICFWVTEYCILVMQLTTSKKLNTTETNYFALMCHQDVGLNWRADEERGA